MRPRKDQLEKLFTSLERHAVDAGLRQRLREAIEREKRAGGSRPDGYGDARGTPSAETAAIKRLEGEYARDRHNEHVRGATAALEDAVVACHKLRNHLDKLGSV